jgi:GT2 family glycosyltransferase
MTAQNVASRELKSGLPDLRPCGWKILHIELSSIGPISLEPGYDGLYLCFWHESRPLGHVELLGSELPLSEAQVRRIAANAIAPAVKSWLERLDPDGWGFDETASPKLLARLSSTVAAQKRGGGAKAPPYSVSLVICTRDRPERLERCLRSVAALTFQPSEIVVVDNGSRCEETRSVAAQFARVRYVVEPRRGLSRARNTGVRASSSPLIAFTDDDIVLSPEWLRHLTEPLRDPQVSAASGLVFPAELRTRAQIVFEQEFGGFNQGYAPRLHGPDFITRTKHKAAPVWSICAGGNMIVRRATFDKVGLFDERLGAGEAGCSEDSEFWYRILANGGSCAYVPAAVVHHYHREDIESLRQQIFMYMRGHVAALLVQSARFRHWNNLHRILIELPLGYAEMLLRAVLSGDRRNMVLFAGARGSAAGIWFWLRHWRGGYEANP